MSREREHGCFGLAAKGGHDDDRPTGRMRRVCDRVTCVARAVVSWHGEGFGRGAVGRERRRSDVARLWFCGRGSCAPAFVPFQCCRGVELFFCGNTTARVRQSPGLSARAVGQWPSSGRAAMTTLVCDAWPGVRSGAERRSAGIR